MLFRSVDIKQWQPEEIGSDEWIKDCQQISLRFLEQIKDNPGIPLTMTEGTKKALSGISTGEICTSLTGIWNGCPEIVKGAKDYELIEDLKTIAVPTRTINIAFDKDSTPKTVNMVRAASNRLAGLFVDKGCDVFEAQWDNKKGKGNDSKEVLH